MAIPLEGAGKGDTLRPIDKKAYDKTWGRVFGMKKTKVIGAKQPKIVKPQPIKDILKQHPSKMVGGIGRKFKRGN